MSQQPRPRKSLANRLIVWFLVLALVPLGLTAVTTSVLFRLAVEREARADLSHAADVKAAAIEGYCTDLQQDVTTLARAPGVVEAAKTGAVVGPGSERLQNFLNFAADTSAFADLLLITPTGQVLFTSHGSVPVGANAMAGAYSGTELAKLLNRVQTLIQADATNFQTYPGSPVPMAFVGSPLLADGRVVGVLVCRLDNERLFQTLNDYGGLGTTGETIVAGEIGGRYVFVAPTRHDPDAAFIRTVRANGTNDAVIRAALAGSGGSGEGVDYRGEPVIGAWRFLPTFGWGLMVKQDQAEAFAAVANSRLIGFSIAGVLVPLVVIAAWVVARSITRPLRSAAAAAEAVSRGDLTVRVDGPVPDDEAGMVADSLGTMTGNLAELVGRIKNLGHGLGAMSAELAATGRQQEATATAFDGAASDIASAVHEIAATGQELQGTVAKAGTAAMDNAEVARAGRAGLAALTQAMQTLADGASGVGRRLSDIEAEAERVGAVVATIAEIAEQANLLSVNAAIEAEKAGETGRGFRVVAREIRRLADRTTTSTTDVEVMVTRMASVVSAGVKDMAQFWQEVQSGITAADLIAADMVQIMASADSSATRFIDVREGIKAQTEGTRQIDVAMSRLTHNAREAAAGASELKAAAEHLRAAIAELDAQIAGFNTTPRSGSSSDSPGSA